ncbi:hypothetical protein [Bradyrhizobium sp. Arg816]|uniref:hypothetical protein n=1 Tax=Bradyrhizobium sp. Arg816 TaxID=2998491 RepID=UPI00249D8F21|nr:hypothetical protein [Bradyrhizobium sp. Arg816]MDI3560159.1 hypothetical protein [Bradyrhizobium sp. Arg816]
MRPTVPSAYHVRIDRLVIDGPSLAAADAARFERALLTEFSRLAEARPAPPPHRGDWVGDLARHVARSMFDTLKEGAR